jgi:hypothetical protein
VVVQREVGVRVDVDKAWRDAQALNREFHARAPAVQLANRDDALVCNRHIRAKARIAQPVKHCPAAQQDIAALLLWHRRKDT